MNTKILFITIYFFTLFALKSNGQTNTTQTLDEKYPYYYVFWENEKITIVQYANFDETKRKELSVNYEAEIEEEIMFTSSMTAEALNIGGIEYEIATIKSGGEENNKKEIDSLYNVIEILEKRIEENRLEEIRKKIENDK